MTAAVVPQPSGDRPKQHLAEDLPGCAAFSRAIARGIVRMTPQDGIVLAVNGPWGSGKTSAANMVVEALAQLQGDEPRDHGVLVVRFNPWQFSGQSAASSPLHRAKAKSSSHSGFVRVGALIVAAAPIAAATTTPIPAHWEASSRW